MSVLHCACGEVFLTKEAYSGHISECQMSGSMKAETMECMECGRKRQVRTESSRVRRPCKNCGKTTDHE